MQYATQETQTKVQGWMLYSRVANNSYQRKRKDNSKKDVSKVRGRERET